MLTPAGTTRVSRSSTPSPGVRWRERLRLRQEKSNQERITCLLPPRIRESLGALMGSRSRWKLLQYASELSRGQSDERSAPYAGPRTGTSTSKSAVRGRLWVGLID